MRQWRSSLLLVPAAIIFCTGLIGFAYGRSMPIFGDSIRAMQAFHEACTEDGVVEGWWRNVDQFRTHRSDLIDAGAGLMLLTSSVCVLALALALTRVAAEQPIARTPRRSLTFFGLGVFATIGAILASQKSLEIDLGRFEFPPCADSIAIPVFEVSVLGLVFLSVALLVGWLVSRAFGTLPADLRQWNHARPLYSWAVSLLCGCGGELILALTVSALLSSMFLAVPSGVMAIYLVASTRAALLAPRKLDEPVLQEKSFPLPQ